MFKINDVAILAPAGMGWDPWDRNEQGDPRDPIPAEVGSIEFVLFRFTIEI